MSEDGWWTQCSSTGSHITTQLPAAKEVLYQR
jgi:hypothetical protein